MLDLGLGLGFRLEIGYGSRLGLPLKFAQNKQFIGG